MEESAELLSLINTGDKAAREQMILGNTGLIWSVVRRFINRGYDSEDLFQIGCIGLIKAIDNFNHEFNVKFSTYAIPMITGEIKRFLRDDGIIKISRSIKENQVKIIRAKEDIRNELGREATVAEISMATNISEEDIVTATEASMEVESLNKVVYAGESNDISLMDRIEDSKEESDSIINRLLIGELLEKLSHIDRKIINLRYFENKTQSQVADILEMTQVQVSRLEKKILCTLRNDLG